MDEAAVSSFTSTTNTPQQLSRWNILCQLSGPEGSVITQYLLEVNKT